MIDTHTHLYMLDYAQDGDTNAAVVKRAIDAGVEKMIFPGVDTFSIPLMDMLAQAFPENIYLAYGFHPTEVKDSWKDDLEAILGYIEATKSTAVGIGEAGIDLYWDKTMLQEQMQVFEAQATKASETGLPLIIHCREGLDQTLEVLQGHKGVKAVFHSFGGSEQDVERIRRVGDFYFGINGIVTFKNSRLREVLPTIGAERILLETDAPFLAPVPHRGKRNESAFLPLIAAHIGDNLGLTPAQVDKITTENAFKLFPRLSV